MPPIRRTTTSTAATTATQCHKVQTLSVETRPSNLSILRTVGRCVVSHGTLSPLELMEIALPSRSRVVSVSSSPIASSRSFAGRRLRVPFSVCSWLGVIMTIRALCARGEEGTICNSDGVAYHAGKRPSRGEGRRKFSERAAKKQKRRDRRSEQRVCV